MKRTVMVVGCAILFATLLSSAAFATGVGNIDMLGKDQEQGFSIGLGMEHFTRQMDLDGTCTVATAPVDLWFETPIATYYSVQYGVVEYAAGMWMDGTGYFEISDLQEKETIDRYFLEATYSFGQFEVAGRYGLGRLIPEWQHYYLTAGVGPYQEMDGEVGFYQWEDAVEGSYYWDEAVWFINPGITFEDPMELGLERSDWGPFYGLGLKMLVHEEPGFKMGFAAHYGQQQNKDMGLVSVAAFTEGISYDSTSVIPLVDNGGSSSYELGMGLGMTESTTTEMALSLIMSGQVGQFSPYGGVKYSTMKTDYTGELYVWAEASDGEETMRETEPLLEFPLSTVQTDSLGMFAGGSYQFTDKISGNVELQIFDEVGVSTGLSIGL